MKKTLLLFLFILPFLGFSQADLVKWNAASSGNRNTPAYDNTLLYPTASVSDISVSGGVSLIYNDTWEGGNPFFMTGSWPNAQENEGSYNANKYIEFKITPTANRKIDLSTFYFTYRSQGGSTEKFQIQYSKNNTFTNDVKVLVPETISSTNWTTINPAFSSEINPVLPGQIVYVRVYVYNSSNNFHFRTGISNTNTPPIMRGTISNFDSTKILAINDYLNAKKEVGINISPLNNDVNKAKVSSIVLSTPPLATQGTAIINPDKTITFNPAKNFTGKSTFKYTISDGTKSSEGTIEVIVSDVTSDSLVIWDAKTSTDRNNPTINSSFVSAANVTNAGIPAIGYNNSEDSNNPFYTTGSWPNTQENGGNNSPTKYVQFSITADAYHKVDLTTFGFTYRAQGGTDQKFKIDYSKSSTFSSNVKSLVTGTTTTTNWTTINPSFASDLNTILPGETVYIRLYVYNTYDAFHFRTKTNIKGSIKDVNTLTANDDAISTPSNVAVVIPILANDVVGGSALQAITVTQPLNGTVTVNGTTNITFTPATNFSGSASFTYTLRNANSNYSSATVNVNGTAPICAATESAGINYWKGFVYTYTGTPAATTYVGSVAEKPIFDRNVGEGTITGDTTLQANNFCGTVPSDKFFVRYLMQTTVATTETYSFNIGGDDGVRLYIDGTLVTMSPANSWGDHSYIRYAAQYTLTAGTHNFVLEYYENAQSARVSFSYGAIKGDTTFPFGDNKWNVYGFSLPDISLIAASYAGTYVDTNLNINTQSYWNKTKSPSYATNWQGAPIDVDQFAITYKRQGFDCGRYQIQLVNCDDVAEIYIDGVKIFTQNGYTNALSLINNGEFYPLDKNSKVEVRLREDGGDANVAFNFIYAATVAPVASVTQPSCGVNTGTITFSSPTPATGITYSIDGTTYTNTTGIFSGVAVGTYNISTKNSSGCTSAVTTVNVNAATNKTWNGTTSSNWNTATNWTPNGVPTASDCVVIPDLTNITNKPVVSGNAVTTYANVLTVTNKGSLIIESSNTIKVENAITVEPTGSLVFENYSSLLQTNNNPNINTGKITYKRIAPQIRQADYTYWSTPVSPQRLIDVSPLSPSDKFFYYTTSGWKSIAPTNNMVIGKGYIIRGPSTFSNTAKADYPAEFKGVPNNGTLTGEFMATPGKFYLIGNPYPSALSADAFIQQNTFLEGTLYFWTHNTPVVLTGAYKYSSTDYASYNLTGSVRTGITAVSGNPSNPKQRPTGFIGAGQSFFAAGTSAGTVTFNNDMRFGGTNNTQFFKSTGKETAIEKNRLWLNMTNTEGAFKQMLVGYIQGASNEYETRYDGLSFDANPYLDFYSIANGNDYVIQGRALPFTDTDEVPLGYRTKIAGDFTISIDEVDGDLANQTIYLEDKITGTIHDLTQSDYKFTTAVGTFTDRLVLKYKSKTLGTGDFENSENGLLISVKNKTIQVTSSKEALSEVSIYDITGKLIYNKKKVGTKELQISNLPVGNQVMLAKVTLENGYVISKKLIFK